MENFYIFREHIFQLPFYLTYTKLLQYIYIFFTKTPKNSNPNKVLFFFNIQIGNKMCMCFHYAYPATQKVNPRSCLSFIISTCYFVVGLLVVFFISKTLSKMPNPYGAYVFSFFINKRSFNNP